jgi:Rrf2 family protein
MGTLPRQVEYALIGLSDMVKANPGELFAVRGLCGRHQIPFDVMSKTMQRLGRAGILRSVKGVNGGYQIIRNLTDVSLLELMEAIMGKVGAVKCLRDGMVCPRKGNCVVSASMAILDRRLKAVYESTTVMELLGDDVRPGGRAEKAGTGRRRTN